MRARAGWQIWLMLLLPPITLGLLIFAYLALAGLDPAARGAEEAVRSALPFILGVNHVLLFSVLLVLLKRNGESLRHIGWVTRGIDTSVSRELLIGVVCALGLYLFKELAVDSLRALLAGRTPTFTSLFRFGVAGLDLPLAVAATSLVFIEESIYRGFALPPLRERFGVLGAVVATSVAFGLLHWGNGLEAIVFTGMIGALLAVIYLWRGNLVAGTTAHALYNLAVLLT